VQTLGDLERGAARATADQRRAGVAALESAIRAVVRATASGASSTKDVSGLAAGLQRFADTCIFAYRRELLADRESYEAILRDVAAALSESVAIAGLARAAETLGEIGSHTHMFYVGEERARA